MKTYFTEQMKDTKIAQVIHNQIFPPDALLARIQGKNFRFPTETGDNNASLSHSLRKEQKMMGKVADFLDSDDVFFDIGAHFGIYSCAAATEIDSHGCVVAIEPMPNGYKICCSVINEFDCPSIVHRCAFSDEHGIATLQGNSNSANYQKLTLLSPDDDATNTIEAPMTSGDQFISDEELPPPNVLKIDVEGAESKVLRGLENAINRDDCRGVFLEKHHMYSDQWKITPEEILTNHGFFIKSLQKEAGTEHILATK
jgi:FkbM family methyltransferase